MFIKSRIELHNIEQLMNINLQLHFVKKKKNSIFCLIPDGQHKKISLNAFHKYMYCKNLENKKFS